MYILDFFVFVHMRAHSHLSQKLKKLMYMYMIIIAHNINLVYGYTSFSVFMYVCQLFVKKAT